MFPAGVTDEVHVGHVRVLDRGSGAHRYEFEEVVVRGEVVEVQFGGEEQIEFPGLASVSLVGCKVGLRIPGRVHRAENRFVLPRQIPESVPPVRFVP